VSNGLECDTFRYYHVPTSRLQELLIPGLSLYARARRMCPASGGYKVQGSAVLPARPNVENGVGITGMRKWGNGDGSNGPS